MKSRTFSILFYSLVGLCLLLTIGHLIYAWYAYQHASIIQFIAREVW